MILIVDFHAIQNTAISVKFLSSKHPELLIMYCYQSVAWHDEHRFATHNLLP